MVAGRGMRRLLSQFQRSAAELLICDGAAGACLFVVLETYKQWPPAPPMPHLQSWRRVHLSKLLATVVSYLSAGRAWTRMGMSRRFTISICSVGTGSQSQVQGLQVEAAIAELRCFGTHQHRNGRQKHDRDDGCDDNSGNSPVRQAAAAAPAAAGPTAARFCIRKRSKLQQAHQSDAGLCK